MQATDTQVRRLPAAEVAAWLRLAGSPGVGRRVAASLLQHFGDPAAIFAADFTALTTLVTPAQARALLAPPPAAAAALLDATLAWLAQPGNHLLTLLDPAYPALLREIGDAPIVLYIKGRAALLAGPLLAIVGSRNASVQGQHTARAFAQTLSGAGLGIVSGLALGIDAAAHAGALDGGAGTVAVIGTGADRIYPARNDALARRIAEHGCIVSEYPLGTPPRSENFPQRNRIISGLAAGVLVVEAAAQSGSLITARLAAQQGREVFALPGSVHSALAKGCHQLIREGAGLVESVADLAAALRISPLVHGAGVQPAPQVAATAPESAVLALLGQAPMHVDTLGTHAALAPGELSSALLALELAGHIERLPGGLLQRVYPG